MVQENRPELRINNFSVFGRGSKATKTQGVGGYEYTNQIRAVIPGYGGFKPQIHVCQVSNFE